ncbi:hypothetical protein THIX_40088 [Thiomonas sp. X19]|nr:hypothetical protein THIX_40088 [Thiomonas sp. X19]
MAKAMIVIMTSKDGRNFISVSPHGIDGPHNLLSPAFWPLIVAVALRSALRSRRSALKDHRARSSQRRCRQQHGGTRATHHPVPCAFVR